MVSRKVVKERLKRLNVYEWGGFICAILVLVSCILNLQYPVLAGVVLEVFFFKMSDRLNRKNDRDRTYNRHDLWL